MASTDNEVPAPIIVKKIKKGGGGHHGGAWKVAYADFVTAMMAFFLLMWLLNVTTEEQKNAISNYFDPTHPKVSMAESGSGGILGGLTVSPDGAMSSVKNPLVAQQTPTPQSGNQLGEQKSRPSSDANDGSDKLNFSNLQEKERAEEARKNGINILDEVQQAKEAELQKLKEQIEAIQNETFEAIKEQIYAEIAKSPELAELEDHLMIDITPEGLRIQIVDKEGRSMFPSGQAGMFDFMEQLLSKVTQVVIPQPNQLSVRGHTDGVQYPEGSSYDNWNLSADRALASRAVMLNSGLSGGRIETVVGRADREHLLPDEPLSPRNRRISIVLLRQKLETEDQINKAAGDYGIDRSLVNEASQPVEDREDIPQLDRTVPAERPVEVINPNLPKNGANITPPNFDGVQSDMDDLNQNTDIADEIRLLQEQKKARENASTYMPEPLPTPSDSDNESQFIQF